MKTTSLTLRSTLFLYLLAISINGLVAQIGLSPGPGVTPEMMVESILMEGISYSNVTFQGHNIARGIFTNGKTTNLGIESGIFITSGSWTNIPGPNNTSSATTNHNLPGHPLLSAIAGYQTYDASVLSFDFVPETDTLRIRYVFGSEDYNEWVGGVYNDVFGCFITGPDPSGGYYTNKNIAIIPDTANTPITINTVNNGYATSSTPPTGPCMNCEYFTDNTGGLTLQYDAKTVVMTAWVLVVPCEVYSIIIGVADGGDPIGDAGAFIEENSIVYPKITTEVMLVPTGLTEHLVEGFVSADVIFKLPHVPDSNTIVCLEITGTAENGVDYEWIDNCISFDAGYDTASIRITPLFDGIVEGDETIQFIFENSWGCQVRHDTIELIIHDYNEMYLYNTPQPVICPGEEIELYTNLAPNTGYPPYSYLWEPGPYTTEIITVSPGQSTYYKVTITDLFMQTVSEFILVTVLPGHLNEMVEFKFEAANNPFLPGDIAGTITGDSILVILPSGQDAENLIATFTISDCAEAYVAGDLQISGVTANDFNSPVTYEVMAANGDIKEWVVMIDFSAGQKELLSDNISLFPNPAKDRIQIMGAAGYEVSLYSGFGVKLLQKTINDNNSSLDVGQFEPGIYYLKLDGRDHRFVR
ncbi:MAG: choice-of-anchor L domain-containing protein, partial [Bacteroidales bacterium]